MRKLLDLARRAMGVAPLQDELRRMRDELRGMNRRLAALESHGNLETKWRGHFTDKVDALVRRLSGGFLGCRVSGGAARPSLQAAVGRHHASLLAGAPNHLRRDQLWRFGGGELRHPRAGIRLARSDGGYGPGEDRQGQAKFGTNPQVSFEAVAVSPRTSTI